MVESGMWLKRSSRGSSASCEGRGRLGCLSILWILALGLWAVGEVDPSWATSPTDKADPPSDKAVAGRDALSLAPPPPPPLNFQG